MAHIGNGQLFQCLQYCKASKGCHGDPGALNKQGLGFRALGFRV